ncbi:DUF2207 domain-containing protein [Oerskovia sp. M15]
MADVADRAVTRYAVSAQVERDGTLDVSIDMDYDFRGDEGHGPTLEIPTFFEIDGDPDHLRRYEVSDVQATSASGAAADVQVEDQGWGTSWCGSARPRRRTPGSSSTRSPTPCADW